MSERPRLQVIVPIIAATTAALGLGMFMLTRAEPTSTSSSATLRPLKTVVQQPPAAAPTTKPATKPAVSTKPATTPAASTKPKAKATPKPKPRIVVARVKLNPGLPSSVAAALQLRKVAVVVLYSPRAPVDDIVVKEARAGAEAVGAAFVALNVLDERQARPLTTLLGMLEDPTVLVFRRPGDVAVTFDGFADRETVAQAAQNAAS